MEIETIKTIAKRKITPTFWCFLIKSTPMKINASYFSVIEKKLMAIINKFKF